MNSFAQEAPPTLRASNTYALVRENDARGADVTFRITLSPPADRTVLVKYATVDGSATAPSDYAAVSGTLIFPPGSTEQVVTVHVSGNSENEPNEVFYLDLSEPLDARIETPRIRCGIYDGNPAPEITIDDTRVVEGDEEFSVSAFFKLHLSFPTEKAVLIDMQTIAGTAREMDFNDPTPGLSDYYGSFGTVGFLPGETETQIEIPLNSDRAPEPTETFRVAVSSDSAVMTRNFATATIVDDDSLPAVSVKGANGRELSYASTNLRFEAVLSRPSDQIVEVNFATQADSATPDVDYVSRTGTLVFAPGVTSQTISVEILPDQTVEDAEYFTMQLSSPKKAVLGVYQVRGEILDAVNEIPTVRITSPAASDTFVYPANIDLSASAEDLDGTIQRVEFWINDQKVGEAVQEPYTYHWESPLPGPYKVIARAFDNHQAGASSKILAVTIGSNAKVSIISPVTDSAFASGENIDIAATVASDLQPSRLEFWADNTLIGTDDTAPYSFSWNTSTEGPHLIVVKAIRGEEMFESAPVRVSVGPARPVNDMFVNAIELSGFSPESNGTNVGATTQPGEPIHGSPSAGASLWWRWTAPGNGVVTLTTSNSPSGHYFIAVYSGDTLANLKRVGGFQDIGSIAITNGVTYFVAVDGVNDQRGAVQLQLALSAVTFGAPVPDSIYTAPAQIPFSLLANDGGQSVSEIELRQGSQLVAAITGPPFAFTWTNVPNGYYQVYAVGKDRLGGTRQSPAISFIVKPSNDDFENAITLFGYSTNVHASNYGATLQLTSRPGERRTGEPVFFDNEGGHSIWYNWTAPDDGLATISGAGSNFSLLIQVHVGNNVFALEGIADNATTPLTPVTFTARKGVTYRISIDGLYGEEGVIDWSLWLHARNDDFALRKIFTGSSYEAFAMPRGATRESFESSLNYPANAVSLWWSWAAPASGPVTISTASDTVPTQLIVCTGDPFALAIVRRTSAWATNSSVTFTAQAGTLYHFAVLSYTDIADVFSVRLFLDILQLTSPADGAVYETPAIVPLSVSKFGGLASVQSVDYFVNGSLAVSSSEPPFSTSWTNSTPGNYVISAKARLASGAVLPSLGESIQLYQGHELPQPRLIQNTEFGSEIWVINAVGSLYAMGNGMPTFGAPATGINQLPTQGKWPAGVRNWKAISCVNSYQDSHTWSLTDDGVLYKDGQTKVPFPPGVSKWVKLTPNATAIGDDGNFYSQGGVQLTFRSPAGVRWKDAGGYSFFFYTLAEDGRLFLQGTDSAGNSVPNAFQVPFPPGVTGWSEMKFGVSNTSLGWSGILRASDGRLFRMGAPPEINKPIMPEEVPLPPGVTHFVSFASGNLHFLAIGDDGDLYSWGYNITGQLGMGSGFLTTSNLQKVIKPPGVTGWMAVAAGAIHSAAIGNDCSLYVWGSNDFGQLGLGPVGSQSVPVRVDNLGSLCGIPVIFTSAGSQLPNGAFGIRFATDLNRIYTIQYSDEIGNWKTAFPNVIGNGGLLDWIDSGPPLTETAPGQQSRRFYRAIFAE